MTSPTQTKILYLITKSNWGGAQRYVYDLATRLPVAFTPVVAVGGAGVLADKLRAANIPTHTLPNLSNSLSPVKAIKNLLTIKQICQQEQPAVLHVNSSVAGGIGALAGRLAGVPMIIFTAHGWAFNEDRSYLVRKLLKCFHWITVLLAHQTIAVSATTKSQMNWPFAQQKIQVIHNGRTLNCHSSEAATKALINTLPHLANTGASLHSVTIGELHPIKRHDVVIKAIAKARSNGVLIHHTIIGEGSERAALEALVIQLQMTEYIHFAGAIDEAAQYLKAFDVFILASDSEAFGLVVLEARLAGLPVIATKVGGISEIIIHNENGCLVNPGDVDSIARTLTELQTDRTLFDRLSIPQGEAEKFSFEHMLQATTALYRH